MSNQTKNWKSLFYVEHSQQERSYSKHPNHKLIPSRLIANLPAFESHQLLNQAHLEKKRLFFLG